MTEWSDVLGNDVPAPEMLAMAQKANMDLADWIRAQALELWGPDECEGLAWEALAADLRRSADQLGASVCEICGGRIDLSANGWREGDTGDICAGCVAAAD